MGQNNGLSVSGEAEKMIKQRGKAMQCHPREQTVLKVSGTIRSKRFFDTKICKTAIFECILSWETVSPKLYGFLGH